MIKNVSLTPTFSKWYQTQNLILDSLSDDELLNLDDILQTVEYKNYKPGPGATKPKRSQTNKEKLTRKKFKHYSWN